MSTAVPTVPQHFSDPAKYILHPTDFSPSSDLAFAHALRLALLNKSYLTLMHVSEAKEVDWDSFPSVRETLQRWGLLEPGAHRADVNKMGVNIEKINVFDDNVVDAVAGYLVKRPIDLLVLSTEQRHGIMSWLRPSTAERTARQMHIPTLFIPDKGRGCVSLETGAVSMKQVLIPVDHSPPVGGAIERGLRAITAFGGTDARLTLLHVGPESTFPPVPAPSGPWSIVKTSREGKPVDEILAAAEESQADLIIMVTKGTHGLLEALRGTTTEQVIRSAPCPVLSIPADF
jgi:nucleotide-binding universal stress UspA family protein